jgi:hypothetical protein
MDTVRNSPYRGAAWPGRRGIGESSRSDSNEDEAFRRAVRILHKSQEVKELFALAHVKAFSEHACFSCNADGEVWISGKARGWSKEEERDHVRGRSPLLDRIVEGLLRERPKGGRFYVTRHGVYLADGDEEVITAQELARLIAN